MSAYRPACTSPSFLPRYIIITLGVKAVAVCARVRACVCVCVCCWCSLCYKKCVARCPWRQGEVCTWLLSPALQTHRRQLHVPLSCPHTPFSSSELAGYPHRPFWLAGSTRGYPHRPLWNCRLSAQTTRVGRLYQGLSARTTLVSRLYQGLSAQFPRVSRIYQRLSARTTRVSPARLAAISNGANTKFHALPSLK